VALHAGVVKKYILACPWVRSRLSDLETNTHTKSATPNANFITASRSLRPAIPRFTPSLQTGP